MKLGFASIDITPPPGVFLCGQLEPVRAQGVESPLSATAFCLDDGAATVLICSCDLVAVSNAMAADIREEAAGALGVPAGQIVIGATHTHSGPNTIDLFGNDAQSDYLQGLRRKVVQVLGEAFANRRDGTLESVAGDMDGFAFNRRFLMSDGTIQTHPLKGDPHLVEPEGPDSTRLDVLCARDCGGTVMGMVVVFGCHATVMERGNALISADYPGKVRARITATLGDGMPVLFLQGASGNICQVNPRDAARREVGVAWARVMGNAIGAQALALLDGSPVRGTGGLRVATATLAIPRRETTPALAAWAGRHQGETVPAPGLSDYGVEPFGRLPASRISLDTLFKTAYWARLHANEITALERARAGEPAVAFAVSVIAMDTWALVALPCELFVEWAEEIRRHSPFAQTLVVELANGWNGYVPTPKAFARAGGYETKNLSSSLLAPEAGALICRAVRTLLESVKDPQPQTKKD